MRLVEDVPEKPTTLKEALEGALEVAELEGLTGAKFFLAVDTQEFSTFITNEHRSGDLLLLLEQAKLTIITAGDKA